MVSPFKSDHLNCDALLNAYARNYQSIWTEQGSPLLAITKQQQAGLQAYLIEQGINAQVEIAMTYGNPSMQSAVKNLLKNDIERMIVLPLYPQYSSTTTGALIDAFRIVPLRKNVILCLLSLFILIILMKTTLMRWWIPSKCG